MFDVIKYEHECNQYFSMVAAREYFAPVPLKQNNVEGVKVFEESSEPQHVVLWTDCSDGKCTLCHTFLRLFPGWFLDAYGCFNYMHERTDEDTFESPFATLNYYDVAVAANVLKSMKIPYTNVAEKRIVRDYLRSNRLVFDVTTDAGNTCKLGYIGNVINGVDRKGNPKYFGVFCSYYGDGTFGKHFTYFTFEELYKRVKGCDGFKPIKRG